jgi:Fic family protein
MSSYIHELEDWPQLRWNQEQLAGPLAAVRHRQGRLLGRMEALGFALREQAVLQTLTQDVLETSQIEGETLDREQVRSSLARRLGLDIGALTPADRYVDGVVEMLLDATQRYDVPLTEDRLFDWHASLFPTGRNGLSRIRVGVWRDDQSGPMQVVSGPIGRERVHFQAPAAFHLPEEIAAFLTWFNDPAALLDPVLKAGVAHLWFVTLHPFDDGNGRIARAIGDMALARSEGTAQRFYSLSAQIRQERKAYYDVLERIQQGGLDVTGWLEWFLGCLDRAFAGAETTLGAVLRKALFWEAHAGSELNGRQRLMLNRLLDGFAGKLTSSKWAVIMKCSQDTALRDILDLTERGILVRDLAGGRSTSYSLVPRP